MTEQASFAPQMLHPEQVSEQQEPEKPWLRQQNEPAKWFMRFKIYKDLGPKRTMQAAIDADTGKEKQEKAQTKSVSIPGSWSRAAKVWNWKARAQAYDLAEQAKDAVMIREFAGRQAFSSRAYRLVQLNYTAKCLKLILESWKAVPHDQTKDYLSIVARYQSVLRDIETSMQGLDVANDTIDAAAWDKLCKEWNLLEKFNQKK
jgi:hypothetical protein